MGPVAALAAIRVGSPGAQMPLPSLRRDGLVIVCPGHLATGGDTHVQLTAAASCSGFVIVQTTVTSTVASMLKGYIVPS